MFLIILQHFHFTNRLYYEKEGIDKIEIGKLVQKAKKGYDEAFEGLISSVRNKLYRTAYSYVRNEQDALDIYQETIYIAYTSLKTLKKQRVSKAVL